MAFLSTLNQAFESCENKIEDTKLSSYVFDVARRVFDGVEVLVETEKDLCAGQSERRD